MTNKSRYEHAKNIVIGNRLHFSNKYQKSLGIHEYGSSGLSLHWSPIQHDLHPIDASWLKECSARILFVHHWSEDL